jgi:fumarylacetoacetate (FAA) hydrolase
MRIARIETGGERGVAVLAADGTAKVVSTGGQDELVALAAAGQPPDSVLDTLPLDQVRLLAPVERPPSVRDFFAFEDHVRNSRAGQGLEVDPGWYERPLFYFSNPAAIYGPDDEITVPRDCRAFDYELEVACVIGREAADLDPDDPATMEVIAGFTILNDWSARDLQAREMTQNLGPAKGKDFATSLGPCLVTPDEFAGVAEGKPKAAMAVRVNGTEKSSGELQAIHFPWTALLAYASANTRLVPGDVLGSGTCGTGCLLEWRMTGHRDTHPWLRPGDVVELDVEHIGVLRNTVVARSA